MDTDTLPAWLDPNGAPVKSENGRGDWLPVARDLAFDVWLTEAGRDLRTAARILASSAYNLPVPFQTLWRWHRDDSWDQRGDQRLADFAPTLRFRSFQFGDLVGYRALSLLNQHLSAISLRVAAATANTPQDAGQLIGVSLSREDLQAVKLGLEAGGLIGPRSAIAAAAGVLPSSPPLLRPSVPTTQQPDAIAAGNLNGHASLLDTLDHPARRASLTLSQQQPDIEPITDTLTTLPD